MTDKPNECEACSNVDSKDAPLKLFMGMWMCPSCREKNEQLTAESAARADDRIAETKNVWDDTININKLMKQVDASPAVQIKTDIFVSEIQSIQSVKEQIDTEPITENEKANKLAEIVLARFNTYKEKIFANNQENMELANKQNAIQKYLNELKNKLTQEQREKYKLLDINYKPNQVKLVAAAQKKERSTPKKYDKAELHKAAERAGVPVSVIQMMCVAKHMTPMQASDTLLNAGSRRSES